MVDRCDPLIDQLPLDLLQSHLEIHHAGRTRLNDLFDLVRMSIDKTGADIPSVRIDFFIILYMKEIVKGESYVMLSQEEVEALRKAVNFGLDNIEE